MKAKIFSKTNWIGNSKLKVLDRSMGVIGGDFIPNSNYYSIRDIICNYNDPTVENIDTKYDSLTLNCQLENGLFLNPSNGMLIQDLHELEQDKIVFSIGGVRHEYVKLFFESKNSKHSIIEPWEPITIQQKLKFENQVKQEVGINKKWKLTDLLKSTKTKHMLIDSKFSAVCTRGNTDDVLFELNNEIFKEKFAVIHLTWSEDEKLNSNWPKFKLIKDFKEFYDKMIIENKEYE